MAIKMKRIHETLYALGTLGFIFFIGAAHPAHAGATQWIDIEVVNGHLVVNSEVAGITGRSIIDTGAVGTAINGRFVKAAGLSLKNGRDIEVAGVVANERRPTYQVVEAEIFETPLNFKNVPDLNIGPPELQLLVGADFLNGYVVQFDYPNERMRLISRDSINLKKLKNIKSKRNPDDGSTLVRVLLNDNKKSWLLLDTGATGGLVVSRKLADRMDWIDTYETQTNQIAGVISTASMEHFRVPSVQLGPFNIENVLVSMPAEGEKMELFGREQARNLGQRRNAADGILGYDILKHFIVTVDYGKGYVHLSPGQMDAVD
jgi:predicted aspartyl protease